MAKKKPEQYEGNVKKEFEKIDKMTRAEMAYLWRFAPSGHIYFNKTLPYFNYFNEKFGELGRFTPETSKRIGW